jgi:hypothetical protein
MLSSSLNEEAISFRSVPPFEPRAQTPQACGSSRWAQIDTAIRFGVQRFISGGVLREIPVNRPQCTLFTARSQQKAADRDCLVSGTLLVEVLRLKNTFDFYLSSSQREEGKGASQSA